MALRTMYTEEKYKKPKGKGKINRVLSKSGDKKGT